MSDRLTIVNDAMQAAHLMQASEPVDSDNFNFWGGYHSAMSDLLDFLASDDDPEKFDSIRSAKDLHNNSN